MNNNCRILNFRKLSGLGSGILQQWNASAEAGKLQPSQARRLTLTQHAQVARVFFGSFWCPPQKKETPVGDSRPFLEFLETPPPTRISGTPFGFPKSQMVHTRASTRSWRVMLFFRQLFDCSQTQAWNLFVFLVVSKKDTPVSLFFLNQLDRWCPVQTSRLWFLAKKINSWRFNQPNNGH